MNLDQLSRRQVRYWLFRKQNELDGGANARGAPKGLYARFEAMAVFRLAGGYASFAATWDLAATDAFEIVPRSQSIAEEWNAHLAATAIPVQPL